jgi:ferredoxin
MKGAAMAIIRFVAELDAGPCTGCKLCDLVCPSGAISMVARKAVIDDPKCIGCGRCVDRCPEDIMWMTERSEPLEKTVRPDEADQEKVAALLQTAGLDPGMSVCVCTLTPGSEIAAAIVKGARNLDEVSEMTGMRSGCGIYCVAPALRLLQAAGADISTPKGHRWYPCTLALWDVPEAARAAYPDAFIDSDREAFDPEHRFVPLEPFVSTPVPGDAARARVLERSAERRQEDQR